MSEVVCSDDEYVGILLSREEYAALCTLIGCSGTVSRKEIANLTDEENSLISKLYKPMWEFNNGYHKA